MNPIIYEGIKWSGNPEIDSRLAMERWLERARPKQLLNTRRPEFAYALMMGRGYGKTETGSNATRDISFLNPGIDAKVYSTNSEEVTNVLFEGPSGLLNCIPESCIRKYNRQYKTIHLWNGSKIMGHSVEKPETLRGKQSHWAWFDELAAWQRIDAAYDMIMFGLRLKSEFKTKLLITTTPKPLPRIFRIIADERIIKVFGSTWENKDNLDDNYLEQLNQYKGTVLERQELYGEVLSGEKDLLFKGEWFNLWPAQKRLPNFSYVFQSWDTAFTIKTTNDPSAGTVWGAWVDPNLGLQVILLGAQQDHWDYPALRQTLINEFQRGHGPEKTIFLHSMLVELKATGQPIYDELSQMGFPINGFQPGTKDKVMRASLVTYLAEQGRVWVPEDPFRAGHMVEYALDWYEELTHFSRDPNVIKYQSDNFVDSTSAAWHHLIQMGYGRSVIDFDRKSDYDKPQPSKLNFRNTYI